MGIIAPTSAIAYQHQPYVELRARTLFVEGNVDGRSASTRFRLGVESEWSDRFNTVAELDYIKSFWQADFDDGSRNNGKPFIPDVEASELNQAFVVYNLDGLRLSLGRKRINIDDERFIGSHDFWQDDQSFDGFSGEYSFLSASKFSYHYIAQANRIMGDASARESTPALRLSTHDHDTHLFHLNIRDLDYQSLSFFYYDIDIAELQGASSYNLGIHYTAERHISSFRPSIELSFARQRKSVSDVELPYFLLDTQLGIGAFRLGYRYERLGSNGTQSFSTPLASVHNFHGSADKFGVAPADGLVDQSLSLSWRRAPIRIDARYHQFNSSQGDLDLGSEFDLDVVCKVNKHHEFFLRFADFYSSRISRDRFMSETRLYFNYSIRY